MHARGGYIIACTKNGKVRVSPQCPICYLALRYVRMGVLTSAYLLILK